MNKIEELKMESVQKEFMAMTLEFREALRGHFKTVKANTTRLINTRWEGQNNGG